jgi:pimeloyl-ACP methyl ester carboxylesterase
MACGADLGIGRIIGNFSRQTATCIMPDLPFHDVHPKSAPEPELGKISLLKYVEFLEEKIEKLPVEPILMDHSMGGLLA